MTWAAMSTGEDWLFRPVLAGLLKAESLLSTEIDLNYVADLNEALDVQAENQRRFDRAAKTKE